MPSDLASREVFVVDPMLATGGSAIMAVDALKKRGAHPSTIPSPARKIGTTTTFLPAKRFLYVLPIGVSDVKSASSRLFSGLRTFDSKDYILCAGVLETGLGE